MTDAARDEREIRFRRAGVEAAPPNPPRPEEAEPVGGKPLPHERDCLGFAAWFQTKIGPSAGAYRRWQKRKENAR